MAHDGPPSGTTLRDVQIPRVERAISEVPELRHLPVGPMTYQGHHGIGIFMDAATMEDFITFCRTRS